MRHTDTSRYLLLSLLPPRGLSTSFGLLGVCFVVAFGQKSHRPNSAPNKARVTLLPSSDSRYLQYLLTALPVSWVSPSHAEQRILANGVPVRPSPTLPLAAGLIRYSDDEPLDPTSLRRIRI